MLNHTRNPGSLPDPALDPAAYRMALLSLVGSRNPIEVLERTPDLVREQIQDVSDEDLANTPEVGAWSVEQIIGHLLDDEIINAFRLRQSLTASGLSYPGTDPDRWAVLPKPHARTLVQIWTGMRAFHVHLLRNLTQDQLKLTGSHAEQGPESIEIQILKNAGHDLAHLDQIDRTIRVSGTS